MKRRATLIGGLALVVVAIVLLQRDWSAKLGRSAYREETVGTNSRSAPAEIGSTAVGATATERVPESAPPVEASTEVPAVETVRVEGTVKTREGAVVTDGEVWISVVDFREFHLDLAGWQALDVDEKLARQSIEAASIGEEGRFAVEVPAPGVLCSALVKPLVGAQLVTPIDVEGDVQFAETESDLGELLVTRESVPTLDLRVDVGGTLSGIVVDAASGAPIEGARVVNPWWHDAWSDWGSTTDPEGRFRIAGIDPVVAVSGGAELAVRAKGYVARRVRTAAPEVGVHVSGIRIELQRGVVVRGRCTGSVIGLKRRLDLVLYAVDPAADPKSVVRRVAFVAETSTGDDGRFVFPAVPAIAVARLEIENVVPPLEGRSLDLAQQHHDLVVEVPKTREMVIPRSTSGSDASRRRIDRAVFEPATAGDRALPLDQSSRMFAQVDVPFRITVFSGIELDDDGPSISRREYVRMVRESTTQDDRDRLAADELVAEAVTRTRTLDGRIELTLRDGQGRPIAAGRISVVEDWSASRPLLLADAEGRVVVPVKLGRRFVPLRVAGFETEILEVRAREPCVASLELTLRPLSQ